MARITVLPLATLTLAFMVASADTSMFATTQAQGKQSVFLGRRQEGINLSGISSLPGIKEHADANILGEATSIHINESTVLVDVDNLVKASPSASQGSCPDSDGIKGYYKLNHRRFESAPRLGDKATSALDNKECARRCDSAFDQHWRTIHGCVGFFWFPNTKRCLLLTDLGSSAGLRNESSAASNSTYLQQLFTLHRRVYAMCKRFPYENARVKFVRGGVGQARDRWKIKSQFQTAFQYSAKELGTISLVNSGQVAVVLDRDVRKEVVVEPSDLIEVKDLLQAAGETHIRTSMLQNFPRDADIATFFVCPLSGRQLEDPVVASDGRTYEKRALKDASQGSERSFENFRLKSLLLSLTSEVAGAVDYENRSTPEGNMVHQKRKLFRSRKNYQWCGKPNIGKSKSGEKPSNLELSACKQRCSESKGCKAFSFWKQKRRVRGDRNRCVLCESFAPRATKKDVATYRKLPPVRQTFEKNLKQCEEIVEDFKCPISMEFFIDPVVASDGQTYERGDIEHWLANSKNKKSPLGGALLTDAVFPNRALKLMLSALSV